MNPAKSSRYKLSGADFAARQQEREQRRMEKRQRLAERTDRESREQEDARWERVWAGLIERGIVFRDEEWCPNLAQVKIGQPEVRANA